MAMALLDFPHKKRKKQFGVNMSETDKFNYTVRQLRILLNKLSRDNFDNISNMILEKYNFSPSLLSELTKIIFMKATTESTYLELYVKLCIILFKKYNDKENAEMNFKKLILNKCQKQFFKMLEKEEAKIKSRKESLDAGNAQQINEQQKNSDQKETDFNK